MEKKVFVLKQTWTEKDETYMAEIRELSRRIHTLANEKSLDPGSVLMDVTYFTVAQAICQHKEEQDLR